MKLVNQTELGNARMVIPGHIDDKALCTHRNLFQYLLPTILSNMIFRHHSVRLDMSAGYIYGGSL